MRICLGLIKYSRISTYFYTQTTSIIWNWVIVSFYSRYISNLLFNLFPLINSCPFAVNSQSVTHFFSQFLRIYYAHEWNRMDLDIDTRNQSQNRTQRAYKFSSIWWINRADSLSFNANTIFFKRKESKKNWKQCSNL